MLPVPHVIRHIQAENLQLNSRKIGYGKKSQAIRSNVDYNALQLALDIYGSVNYDPAAIQAARVARAEQELATERHQTAWKAASEWAALNAPDMLARANEANCGCNRMARQQAVIVAWQSAIV